MIDRTEQERLLILSLRKSIRLIGIRVSTYISAKLKKLTYMYDSRAVSS